MSASRHATRMRVAVAEERRICTFLDALHDAVGTRLAAAEPHGTRSLSGCYQLIAMAWPLSRRLQSSRVEEEVPIALCARGSYTPALRCVDLCGTNCAQS